MHVFSRLNRLHLQSLRMDTKTTNGFVTLSLLESRGL